MTRIDALLRALLLAAAGAAAAAAADDAKAPRRFLSPARRDGINDAAAFGADAAEVRVYDFKGRLVFHGERRDGAPIVWDGRDGSGRVRAPGVYIARIRKRDSGVTHQTLVLVK